MKELFEYTIDKYKYNENFVKIRNLSDMLSQLLFPKYTETCLSCGNVEYHPLLAIDIDGTVYPCDSFFGKKEFGISNIVKSSLEDIIKI